MLKRFMTLTSIALLTLSFAACSNKRVNNPIAEIDSKQPDKILYDRAMEAMKRNKFDVARLTLQTLINTYPDSEFVARAKLGIGDSWYAEGGAAALVQAENEYKDFQTFFPNMAEAAEAQLKIANIHYREMEKPDRDFTHALRAEDEYRHLIMQYPDSKLVAEAKLRLLEVQEVLAEREFRIGRFYYLRQSWAAAVARLKSLTETYPLYSGADESLYLLGSAYQGEADAYRALRGLPEAVKGRMIKEAEDNAANAYARILTRYPVMPRAEDAKKQLQALRRPIPTPTPEAIALNKQEEESRSESGLWARVMNNLRKGPDFAQTVKVGEPTLVEPPQASAPQLIHQANQQIINMSKGGGGSNNVSVEPVKSGTPPPNQPVPRSDSGTSTAPASTAPAEKNDVPELQPITGATDSTGSVTEAPTTTNANEPPALQPITGENGSTTPATQAPAATTQQPAVTNGSHPTAQDAQAPPPTQVNEIEKQEENKTATTSDQANNGDQSQASSSSKKKGKKGLRKIVPF